MKNSLLMTIFLVAFMLVNGCKKTDPTVGFSKKIQQIVPQASIDDLKSRGMPINEGTVPPNIEGIFVSNPHSLVQPYGPEDTYGIGDTFSDLIVKFSQQNQSDLSLKIETKNAGATATGAGGFISGNGNKFSIFAELDYVQGSATGKQIRVFSGEITSTGIKDFYATTFFKEKNDPSNILLPVGKSRILKDGNGMASKTTNFRIDTEKEIKSMNQVNDSSK